MKSLQNNKKFKQERIFLNLLMEIWTIKILYKIGF